MTPSHPRAAVMNSALLAPRPGRPEASLNMARGTATDDHKMQ